MIDARTGKLSVPEALQVLAAALAAQVPTRAQRCPQAGTPPQADALAIARQAVQLYAESHPRPTQVTIGQAAAMLGISRWKATQLLRTGTLRLNKCGLIPVEMVDAARS